MKNKELRKLNTEELQAKLEELQRQTMKEEPQSRMGTRRVAYTVKNNLRLRENKKDIARIKTIVNSRK